MSISDDAKQASPDQIYSCGSPSDEQDAFQRGNARLGLILALRSCEVDLSDPILSSPFHPDGSSRPPHRDIAAAPPAPVSAAATRTMCVSSIRLRPRLSTSSIAAVCCLHRLPDRAYARPRGGARSVGPARSRSGPCERTGQHEHPSRDSLGGMDGQPPHYCVAVAWIFTKVRSSDLRSGLLHADIVWASSVCRSWTIAWTPSAP